MAPLGGSVPTFHTYIYIYIYIYIPSQELANSNFLTKKKKNIYVVHIKKNIFNFFFCGYTY